MSKSKILIVDDDPKLSQLVALILSRMGGYEVRQENRSYAVLASAREYRPDVILLDVDMPGKDGGIVAAELQNDPVLGHIPVVFLTSLISKAEAGVRNGARFLAKPVEPKLLLEAIGGLCPRFNAESPSA